MAGLVQSQNAASAHGRFWTESVMLAAASITSWLVYVYWISVHWVQPTSLS